uniref:SecY-independent transporter n=1 Tax=Heterosigma akashiwo TaxID=2829 RepID=D3IUM4_HETAK|nr:SecY-independent transporter protein [Heterosigma akashiwo]AOT84878.1 SecY-independent transporter [Heterosigma akashiwo]BBE27962.1 SecY-independent transporter protein [Heterosigma akashiwo]
MIFSQHIYELKFRFLYILVAVLNCWCVAYWYKYELLYLIQLANSYFIFTHISEVFLSLLKTSFLVAGLVSLPYASIQIGCFLCPCLYTYEARTLLNFLKKLTLVIIIGNFFFLKVLFPWSWQFFSEFETTQATHSVAIFFENRLQDYLNFFVHFFFFFNFTLILILIGYQFFDNLDMLSKFRKFIYLGIVILSACITPPDVISQLSLSAPIILIYEFKIFTTRLYLNYVNSATN